MGSYEIERHAETRRRGDTVRAVQFTGRRVTLSAYGPPIGPAPGPTEQQGFSLMELVITITVMTILTMGVIPLI